MENFLKAQIHKFWACSNSSHDFPSNTNLSPQNLPLFTCLIPQKKLKKKKRFPVFHSLTKICQLLVFSQLLKTQTQFNLEQHQPSFIFSFSLHLGFLCYQTLTVISAFLFVLAFWVLLGSFGYEQWGIQVEK